MKKHNRYYASTELNKKNDNDDGHFTSIDLSSQSDMFSS